MDQYNIDYFYSDHSQQKNWKGQLQRAFDNGGDKRWQQLTAEEKAEIDARAKTAFEALYYPGATETPGGNRNVKNVFEINQFNPEGHLTVGMWWDNYGKAKDYYKKRGFRIENVVSENRAVEGDQKLKEIR